MARCRRPTSSRRRPPGNGTSALGASAILASRQASAAAARRSQQASSDRSEGNGLCTSGATAGRCFPSLATTSRKAARMPGGSGT
eukprot:14034177-Alexandrium_andersonii.AAC.1